MNNIGLRLWEAYLRAEYWVGYPHDRLLLQIGDHATGLSRLAAGAGFGSCGEGYFRLSAFGIRENVVEAVARIKAKIA